MAGSVHSPDRARHFFAFRLRQVLSLTALGEQDMGFLDWYPTDLQRRQVEFLNCLINPQDGRFTYDLRIVSRPDPDLYTRGRISVAVLCRVDGETAADALGYADEVLRLLAVTFGEHEFELAGTGETETLLRPFPCTHMQAITRRCSREALDTLRSGERRSKRIGFAAGARSAAWMGPDETILHIYPYIPPATPFNNLFKLLLLQPDPVAISCRLRPTALTPDEERFVERQIAICERYAQIGLGPVTVAEDLSPLQPTLQQQARMYQQYQSRTLYGLRDNAALMTVEIASTVPISHTLADAVGALVTGPAGWTKPDTEANTFRYLAGGYEVATLDTAAGAA